MRVRHAARNEMQAVREGSLMTDLEAENRRLRSRVAELEVLWRPKIRSEQRGRVRAETRLEEFERTPWVHLPYLGVVPRYVGPGDPLRKLLRKGPA